MAHSKQIVQNPVMVAGIAILAAGVGALTAMLLTPKSGKELRGDISDKARGSRDMARARAHHMKHHMRDKTEEMQDMIMDVADAAKGVVHDVADKASDSTKEKTDEAAAKSKAVSDHIEEEMRRRKKD